MINKKVTDQLIKLMQLDIDAAYAYDQALKNIDHAEILNTISQFRDDHIRHIDDLSREIVQLGGKPPERNEDFKGYLMEGFTSLRSMTGNEGALKAMKMNELLTNKIYQDSVEAQEDFKFSENIQALLKKNYNDEKKHLQYIEYALENRIWEK